MMKKILAALLVLTLLACGAAAEGMTPAAKITVQGNATVTGTADILVISAGVSATDDSMLGAQEKISVIIENTTSALMGLGILAEDIVTTDYSYFTRYDYGEDTPRLTGYEAQHMIRITCRSMGMLDSVIGAITNGGMTEIYDVNYDISNRAELYNEALAQAILAAENKAVQMAAVSGRTITGLDSITENQTYDSGSVMMTMSEMNGDGLTTGIRTGGVSVSAGVTAVYQAN